MASLCSRTSLTRLCSELLRLPVVAMTGGSVCSLIPLHIPELLTFLLYLCLVAGLLLVIRRSSTAPDSVHTCSSGGREAGVLSFSEGNMAAAPPARKTKLAFPCALMLLGMLTFWVFVRQVRCLVPFLMYSTAAGPVLLVFLLDSAKHRFNLGVLLVALGSSGLVHLFVPGNGGSAGLGPAGFELPLQVLLLLGLMGTLMMVSSANHGNMFSFDLPGGYTSTRLAPTLVVVTCAGLVQLLIPTTEDSDESVSGNLKLPVFILFLALMVSLVVLLLRISA